MLKKENLIPRMVTVSQNVLFAATAFDYFELSVIMALLVVLEQYKTYMANSVMPDGLPLIELPFSLICAKNRDRKQIRERLLALRRKDIQYHVPIPGNPITVATGLFSSVITREDKKGGVYVNIAREAIPWLIAMQVGYSKVELRVFNACQGIYVRRLYLYICRKMFNSNASFTISIQELREIIGCPTAVTTSQIISRYLRPLKSIIDDEKNESHYLMSYDTVCIRSLSGVGRRAVEEIKICFILKEEYAGTGKNKYGVVLNVMQKCYTAVANTNLRYLPDVVNDIMRNPTAVEQCLEAYDCYTKRFMGDTAHVANAVFLILQDRFGIDAHNKNTNGEAKPKRKKVAKIA